MLTPQRWILLSDSIEWLMRLFDSSPEIYHQRRIKLIRFYEGHTIFPVGCSRATCDIQYVTTYTRTYNRKFTSPCGKTDESAHNFAVHEWLCHINKHLFSAVPSSNTSLYNLSVPLLASSCIHQLSTSHSCWSSKYNVQRALIETHATASISLCMPIVTIKQLS